MDLRLEETPSRATVETVRITCTGVLPLGDAWLGENEHVESAGSPEQVSAMGCIVVPVEVNSSG